MNSRIIRFIIIAVILTSWIIYAPSHFQKGGVDNIYYKLIPGIIFVCSAVWILPNSKLKLSEKLVLSIFSPLIALFISTLFLMELFIQLRYADKTWFLWENDERIITNTVYYSITIILVIGIIEVYKRMNLLTTKPKMH